MIEKISIENLTVIQYELEPVHVLVGVAVVPELPGRGQQELAWTDWTDLGLLQGGDIKLGAQLLQPHQALQL